MASKLDRLIRNHDRTRCSTGWARCSVAFLQESEGESKLLDIHSCKIKLVIFFISGGLSEVFAGQICIFQQLLRLIFVFLSELFGKATDKKQVGELLNSQS